MLSLAKIIFTVSISLFSIRLCAQDSLDQLTGLRVSLVDAQTLLSAPPLPSLEGEGGYQLPLQAAYVMGQTSDSLSEGAQYSGTFKGARSQSVIRRQPTAALEGSE